MGKDMTMHIVDKDYNLLTTDEKYKYGIYDGRNSEWFSNLEGDGFDNEYDYLPIENFHWRDEIFVKNESLRPYMDKDNNGYFNFRTMRVGKFKEWFEKYRPDLDAGWVTQYDKWAFERKSIDIEDRVRRYPSKEEIEGDALVFIEYEKKYENSVWLYNFVKDYEDDCLIIYCFDW